VATQQASLSFLFNDVDSKNLALWRSQHRKWKRQEMQRTETRPPAASRSEDDPLTEFNLTQATKELNVKSYKTARRLCLTQGCARYSCGAGDEAIFPSTKSKRKTNTRMTWKITLEDIAAIKLKMRKT
jgi:hypothetical protein